jgi:hypothetical protein
MMRSFGAAATCQALRGLDIDPEAKQLEAAGGKYVHPKLIKPAHLIYERMATSHRGRSKLVTPTTSSKKSNGIMIISVSTGKRRRKMRQKSRMVSSSLWIIACGSFVSMADL